MNISDVQDSFLGGEWSPLAQGAIGDPMYRTALAVCRNLIPIEQGSIVRRSGTSDGGPTRGGKPGRVVKFDFKQATPYTMEFTDSHLRFRVGTQLVTTNDSVAVSSISTANPAVCTLASPVTWNTGDEGFFTALGAGTPLLQGRRFTLTKNDTTHFSIADAITGATIDGSTLNVAGLAAGATLNRVLDLATPYSAGLWSSTLLRSVQAETSSFLLHPQFAPQQLIVNALPIGNNFATFQLQQSFFEDGPYLDPIIGSNAAASATSGVVTLTLGFATYVGTTAYTTGQFVTSGGIGYQSLQDANVGNTPASSPTFWKVVGFGAAINNGQGFVASDIGRLVRLFSEPPVWAVGTTYAAGAVVFYNPSGLPGQSTYWSSLVGSNTGNVPGSDTKNWQLLAPGAPATTTIGSNQGTISTQSPIIWTWGKITALSATGVVSGATGTNIGNMTAGGGLTAAFDGVTGKKAQNCAQSPGGGFGQSVFAGKNYGGQQISQVVVYPSSDDGYALFEGGGSVTINLRGSASNPGNSSAGTLLGTSGPISPSGLSPVTIASNDAVTSWNFVWIEMTFSLFGTGLGTIAQVIFYSASAAPGTAVSVEILGPPLLYAATPINTYRLGVYSGTTGYPTCGCYADGRLWLGGAVPNRFDACVTGGINGITNGALPGAVNWAPTDQYGNVLASSGISYTITSDQANPTFWMEPDQQGILLGTQGAEFLIFAPTAGGFAPTNIAARRVTKIGSANVLPARCEHTIAFVQRFQRNLMEFFPDVFSGKFTAPNLAKRARHLTVNNIAEIAFQYEKTPIIWSRCGDGTLIGATYKRDTLMTSAGPTFIGWHRHDLGSGRTVVSLCVGPSVGGTLDAPTFVTFDNVSGLYQVEILNDIFDEDGTLLNASFLDASIAPSSYVVGTKNVTVNGLWDLNGKTVSCFAGGLDVGDYTVSNGSIILPFGDGISVGGGAPNDNSYGQFTASFVGSFIAGAMPILVGFTYTSQGQRLRPITPADTGARIGPGFGKIRRGHQFAAEFFSTAAGAPGVGTVKFGTDFSMLHAALLLSPGGKALGVKAVFTGVHWNTLRDDYSYDSQMCWQVTRPFPVALVLLGGFRATQDT